MMNWFKQNPWLGRFVITLGSATLVCLILLFLAKGSFDRAQAGFNEAASERNRLERLDPFPNEANYKKMKVHIENYGVALNKFKEELKTHVLPVPADLPPNEFQSRLRQSLGAVGEKARANKVRLPENFFMGFDEYTAALPAKDAAPLLGQELAQIQMLASILIEARVDSILALKRAPLAEEHPTAAAAATPPSGQKPPLKSPATSGPKMLERAVVDLKFAASPSATRKVINQIAGANEQFYVIRTLHVRNEKEKGPSREQQAEASTSSAPPKPGALQFIVGNEHIETAATIEIVRFTY
jgi:hypothetical protein